MRRALLLALLAAAAAQDEAAAPAERAGAPAPHAVELRGGTVLVGRLEPSVWKVKTAFGELAVPVAEIRRVRFGRRAQPERLARVDGGIADLASGNPDRRDRARAMIADEGAFAVESLRRAAEGADDPEVRRAATELIEKLDVDEADVLPDEDQIDTARFSVTGDVDLAAFKVHVAELGALVVRRADVAHIRSSGPDRTHRLTIDGTHVWPNNWLDTKIAVRKGARLRISAQGTIFFQNWGQAFTPDGNPNMGMMMPGMMTGALAGRIGEKGQLFRIGSSFAGEAPASGTLQLVIMINAEGQPSEGQFNVVVGDGD